MPRELIMDDCFTAPNDASLLAWLLVAPAALSFRE
jgi:hypothetical protein